MEGMDASPIGSRDCDSVIVKGRRLWAARPSASFIQTPWISKCHQTLQVSHRHLPNQPGMYEPSTVEIDHIALPKERQRKGMNVPDLATCCSPASIPPALLPHFPLATSSSTPIIAVKQLCRLGCHVQVERQAGHRARREHGSLFSRPVPAEFFWSHHSWGGWCLSLDDSTGGLHQESQNTTQGSPVFALCGSPKASADCGHFQCQGERLHTERVVTVPVVSAVWGRVAIFGTSAVQDLEVSKPGFVV